MAKQPRDYNILKSYQKEINMTTRVTKNKKHYTRKIKHKKSFMDF